MNKAELNNAINAELQELKNMSFAQAKAFTTPVTKYIGTPGEEGFCQFVIKVIDEANDSSGSWLNLCVSANDGRGHFGIVKSTSASLLFYQDGRVDIVPPE
jgi:uncharacterized protein with LGFP repeats